MTMSDGIIKAKNEIAPGVFDFTVACPPIAEQAKPGQFVNLKVPGFELRRPISICEILPDALRLVIENRGEGTAALTALEAGEKLDILGPLGHGFDELPATGPALFVGGGIGVPPLLEAAKSCADPHVFLGFRTKAAVILKQDFEKAGADVQIATDDGSLGYHGFVPELLAAWFAKNGPAPVFACGPRPMLKNTALACQKIGAPCYVSMEQRMACGVGACLCCAIQTTGGMKHVCKNGPVFNADEIVW